MSELPIHWHNDQALRTILPSYTTLAGCGEYHAPHDTVARLIFNTPSAGQELELGVPLGPSPRAAALKVKGTRGTM